MPRTVAPIAREGRARTTAAPGLPPPPGGGRMSRRKPRKPKPTRRVQVPIKRLDAIVEQTRSAPLGEDDHATLKAAVDTLARLTEELETKTTTLRSGAPPALRAAQRAHRPGLGERQSRGQTPRPTPAPARASAGDGSRPGEDTPAKPPRTGHGRNGAQDYPRAARIAVAHATLQHGDPCPQPGCTGRVYVQRQEPAVLVRVTGVAPLQAQVYELERLRCGLCGTVLTAAPPAGGGRDEVRRQPPPP